MIAIRFEHVTKQFPGTARPAVDEVSLDIEEGSLVVLLGPSGCGKTTLLKMVNRLVEPDAGAIYLDGKDILQSDPTVLRRQIGYVIQQVGLFPHMTVAENVAVVPELIGWPAGRIQARVGELLDLVDLPAEEFSHRYPSQLSGGQQQRVGVARALAGDPKVILMDEPFGSLDAITRRGLQRELLRLQRRLGKTILFVTHDVEEALYLADKMAVMRTGRIVQYDIPLRILNHPADRFVYDLVGAEDVVRQLGLIRVRAAMSPFLEGFTGNGDVSQMPAVAGNEDLRSALSLLLRTGASALTVIEDSRPVGMLTLDDIRASASRAEGA